MAYKQQFQNKEWKPLWSKEPNEKGYVSESIKRCEKGDQDILKRFMNVVDASQINQVPVGTSVIRAGYKYWLNEGEWGLYIKRRQESDDFESQNTERKQYQGQDYTVKQPSEQYTNEYTTPKVGVVNGDVLDEINKRLQNLEKMLADLMMSFGKDPFPKASELQSNTPNDHGNETSGSNFASGPGTLTDIQGTVSTNADIAREEVGISQGPDSSSGGTVSKGNNGGLSAEEERQLEA